MNRVVNVNTGGNYSPSFIGIDFPHYENAVSGCFVGSSHKKSKTP
jgi:hypothetical protein